VPNKINRVPDFWGGVDSFDCAKIFFESKPPRAIAAEPVKNCLLEMPFPLFFMAHLSEELIAMADHLKPNLPANQISAGVY
jgi:hypothetical protein